VANNLSSCSLTGADSAQSNLTRIDLPGSQACEAAGCFHRSTHTTSFDITSPSSVAYSNGLLGKAHPADTLPPWKRNLPDARSPSVPILTRRITYLSSAEPNAITLIASRLLLISSNLLARCDDCYRCDIHHFRLAGYSNLARPPFTICTFPSLTPLHWRISGGSLCSLPPSSSETSSSATPQCIFGKNHNEALSCTERGARTPDAGHQLNIIYMILFISSLNLSISTCARSPKFRLRCARPSV